MMLLDCAAVFLPLIGAALVGVFGHPAMGRYRLNDRSAQIITTLLMLGATLASLYLFKEVSLEDLPRTHILGTWFETGAFKSFWSLRLDALSVHMIMLVNLVSLLVHLYATSYMKDDPSVPRFMAFLSFFTFFMLILVSANDALQMFFGWEGVGLSSYLLIGFWIKRSKATKAAIKAFLVNRAGDVGFLLALLGCYSLFGSLDFDIITNGIEAAKAKTFTIGTWDVPALTALSFLFLTGAMAKSAQIGFHVWLPDAMEGPTPVSALIHAATMVAAGVFMLARLAPLFDQVPLTLMVISIIGGTTMLLAAFMALTENDVKRVLAYSTMSQLGFMFLAAGISAYDDAMFHLTTHAFFKALLFLAAGGLIHALHHEQDMRKMGGLWKKLPWVYGFMWIGVLSLSGIGIGISAENVWGLSGFYSKEAILQTAFAQNSVQGYGVYAAGVLGTFLTALYAGRLMMMVFHGKPSDEQLFKEAHQKNSWLETLPLSVLALFSIFAGYVILHFEGTAEMSVPAFVLWLPILCSLGGLGLAVWFYALNPDWPQRITKWIKPLYLLALNKFYFDAVYRFVSVKTMRQIMTRRRRKKISLDDLYDFIFVRVIQKTGKFLWQRGDDALIDYWGPDGVARGALRVGAWVQAVQTGFLYHYILIMAFGLLLSVSLALVYAL